MFVLWTVVVDDGTRPYGPGISVDQRRPLHMTAGEDVTIEVSLINPVGGVVLLEAGEFLQLTTRTACAPPRQIFTKRSSAAGQQHRLVLAPGDTQNLEPQRGTFDLWLVRGAARSCLIQLSEFDMSASALGRNYL